MELEELIEKEGTISTGLNLRVGKIRAEVKTTEGLRQDFRLTSPPDYNEDAFKYNDPVNLNKPTYIEDKEGNGTYFEYATQGTMPGKHGSAGAGPIFAFNETSSPPSVTLNSPIDFFNSTNSSIIFNGTVTATNLANVSLILDGVYNETNSSGIEGDYLFTKSLSEGEHNWTYEACNPTGCANDTIRILTIDTAPNVTLTSPSDNLESTVSTIEFKGNVTTPMNDLANVSLIINDVYNETNSSGIEGNYTFVKSLSDGIYNWTYEVCNPSACKNATVRSLTIHTTPATINITEPTGTEDIIALGDNQTITWGITETGQNLTEHITECLFTYNGTTFNVTDICITTNTTSFLYV